jgi:hypothetical protein
MSLGPIELVIICIIGLFFLAILVGIPAAIWFIVKKSNFSTDQNQGNRVPCPFCAELILPEAKICRYCGKDLTQSTSS